MFVMLFVNDVEGVPGVPAWMKHIHPSTADGMTFVDMVFPAFLFMVGVAIPFALGGRLARGVPVTEIWRQILLRTVSLLIIGVFMVNGETISPHGSLSPALWGVLVYGGVFLLWTTVPPTVAGGRLPPAALRWIGIVLLITAAWVYRGNDATGILQMRPQWWGILGLIGWAYLGGCAVYMLCRNNLPGVVGSIALMYCIAIAESVGGLRAPGWLHWLTTWISPGTVFGSQTGITVAGVALGMALAPGSSLTTPGARVRWAFLFGLCLAAAGFLLHTAHHLSPVFIYNKNAATPPWCLISSAVTIGLWCALSLLCDLPASVRQSPGTSVLASIGRNVLLAYLLASVFYLLFDLLAATGMPHFYNLLGQTFVVGVCRSLAFAFLVLWIANALNRRGIHLKL